MQTMDTNGEERPVSPDSQCRICLGPINSKCIADSNCFHKFCLACLIRWSKVKPECPLCKRPFKKILYNIDVSGEFQTLDVQPAPPAEPRATPISFPFVMVRLRSLSQYIEPRDYLPVRNTVSHRREVYRLQRHVQPLCERGGSRRECNPNYFSRNPEQLDRLMPWLKRELQVFTSSAYEAHTIAFDMTQAMMRHSIESVEFARTFYAVLGSSFNHFLHELRSFAESYYDMRGFDENAVYPVQSTRGMENGDSDVELIDVAPRIAPEIISISDSEVEVIAPDCPEITISSDENSDLREIAACTAVRPTNSNVIQLPSTSGPSRRNSRLRHTYHASSSSTNYRDISSSSTSSDSDYSPKKKKLNKSRISRRRVKKRKRNENHSLNASSSESSDNHKNLGKQLSSKRHICKVELSNESEHSDETIASSSRRRMRKKKKHAHGARNTAVDVLKAHRKKKSNKVSGEMLESIAAHSSCSYNRIKKSTISSDSD